MITGGGAGIGAAVGQTFCAEGAGVMLVDADADAVTRKAEQIRQHVAGARVTSFVTDIADAAHMRPIAAPEFMRNAQGQ